MPISQGARSGFGKVLGIIIIASSIGGIASAINYLTFLNDLIFLILRICVTALTFIIGAWLSFKLPEIKKGYIVGLGAEFTLFFALIPFYGYHFKYWGGIIDTYNYFLASLLANFNNTIIWNNILLYSIQGITFFRFRIYGLGFGIFYLVVNLVINVIGMFFLGDLNVLLGREETIFRDFRPRRLGTSRRMQYEVPSIESELESEVEMGDGAYQSAMKIYEKKRQVGIVSNSTTYSKIHLEDDILRSSKNLTCPFCHHLNYNDALICISCKNEFQRCKICHKPIGEDIVFCPSCNAAYHKDEFLEWLKVKACCKECNSEIDIWEFQKVLERGHEIHEEASKLCPGCKKVIPTDANFCIYCGFQVNHLS